MVAVCGYCKLLFGGIRSIALWRAGLWVDVSLRVPSVGGLGVAQGCIYEWMERSSRCPVCDKEMVFAEGYS